MVFNVTHEEFYFMGVVMTLAAITTYTFIGGFLAVSRTDVFQSLIMLGGFIILPVMLIAIVSDPFQGLGTTGEGFGTRSRTSRAISSGRFSCSPPPAGAWGPSAPSGCWPG